MKVRHLLGPLSAEFFLAMGAAPVWAMDTPIRVPEPDTLALVAVAAAACG